jgi:hypothetical protein
MKASGLTTWGVFLIATRGLCAGVWLGVALRGRFASVPEHWLTLGVATVFVASGAITPVLRALGWRGLEVRAGDAGTAPRPGDAERALRSSLGDGLSLREAVRFLHLSRGWDVLQLYPAVATVGNLPPKDAIRLVMETTGETDSGAGRPLA